MKRLMILVLLFACHPDKNKSIDIEKINFKTTDQSEIFFKNIRKSNYDVEELKEAGIEIYRSKKFSATTSYFLRPIIVNNWRNDSASILFDLPTGSSERNFTLIFESQEGESKLLFELGDHKVQTQIALKIYNAVLEKQIIYIVDSYQKKLLFSNETEKETFRITIFDFLRLVEMR